MLGHVRLFATPWTVAHQAPLSIGSFRQEYWSGLPFPAPIIAPADLNWPQSPQLRHRMVSLPVCPCLGYSVTVKDNWPLWLQQQSFGFCLFFGVQLFYNVCVSFCCSAKWISYTNTYKQQSTNWGICLAGVTKAKFNDDLNKPDISFSPLKVRVVSSVKSTSPGPNSLCMFTL